MLAIKLKRIGKKHQAAFRVVIAEKRSKLKGRFIEDLGWMSPHSKSFEVKNDRVKYWISVGAKPTSTVHNLLVSSGVIEGKKISLHKKSKKKKGVEATSAPAVAEVKIDEAKIETQNADES